MTGRDRIVVIVLATVAVLGAGWMLVVSPEREKASKLGGQVASAQSTLNSAEGELSQARSAQTQYASAYASVVGLGKAVPAQDEVPSLIYQLERASNSKNVEFASITTSGGSGSSSTAAAAPAAASAGFTAMPFTFIFNGTYFDLEHLFEGLDRFTLRTTSGSLQVSGRLLTIQSVKLTPIGTTATGGPVRLTGTITATAYVLPASEGLTAGATPSSPSGAATTASAAGSTSAATPAVVEVNP